MIQNAALGGATSPEDGKGGICKGLNGERSGRRGGLGVFYQTKGSDGVKGQETDFVALSPVSPNSVRPHRGSLLPRISNLVYSMPTDTLNDIAEDKKTLPIRHGLLRKHARVRMLTTHRDAHMYFFPLWVLDMIRQNDTFDSISEDVVGWWAKAGWQQGLGEKLGLRSTFETKEVVKGDDGLAQSDLLENEIQLGNMSTTWTSFDSTSRSHEANTAKFASRVKGKTSETSKASAVPDDTDITIPPILAYIHPSLQESPLIRRCDTTPLLLTLSLVLAKLPALDSPDAPPTFHPFSHKSKIAHRSGVAARSTVIQADCLLGDNVVVEEKCVIKETVIGAGCKIATGARLTRCVLMDHVDVAERAQLSGCVIGRRSAIGKEAVLRDCEVQEGYAIAEKSEGVRYIALLFLAYADLDDSTGDAKNEKFMIFEGLDDGEEGGVEQGTGIQGITTA